MLTSSLVYYAIIIKGEEIKAYELEIKIPQLDIDQDSAMGISIFTGGKSTTLSEVSYPMHLLHTCSATVMFMFLLHSRILWTKR